MKAGLCFIGISLAVTGIGSGDPHAAFAGREGPSNPAERDVSPSRLDACFRQAEVDWSEGRTEAAVACFQTVFEADAKGIDVPTRQLAVSCRRLLEYHSSVSHLRPSLTVRRRLIRLLEAANLRDEAVAQSIILGGHLLQTGQLSEAGDVLTAALDRRPGLVWEIRCRQRLAALSDRLGDTAAAQKHWQKIAALAESSLADNWQLYQIDVKLELTLAAASARQQAGNTRRAVALLSGFVDFLDGKSLPEQQVELLLQIAHWQRSDGDFDAAHSTTGQAVAICRELLSTRTEAKPPSSDAAGSRFPGNISTIRLLFARVLKEKALIERQRKRFPESESLLVRAIEHCEARLRSADAETGERTQTVGAAPAKPSGAQTRLRRDGRNSPELQSTVELLTELYVLMGRLQDGALPMLKRRLAATVPQSVQGRHLRLSMALLQRVSGNSEAARELLMPLRNELRRLAKPEPQMLLRVLNQLASVEFAAGNYSAAESLCTEADELTDRYLLPDSLHVAESFNNLGQVLVYQGRYTQGVEALRRGLEITRRLGRSADQLRATVLLNLAMAHRSQGQLDAAVTYCRQSLELHRLLYGPNSLAAASLYNALAGLLSSQGHFRLAADVAGHSISICRSHDRLQHPAVAVARHFVALNHLAQRDFSRAEQEWQQAFRLQQQFGQPGRSIRTLTYLATVARLCGDHSTAQERLHAAIELHRKTHAAPPVVQFLALSTLGELLLDSGQRDDARELLQQAIEVSESPRASTYGADSERAQFFAQFSSAFDTLFRLHVESGDLDAAFRIAERSRNRTFLDQMAAAGIDPRHGVDPELLEREQEARRRLNALRLQLRLEGRGTAVDDPEESRPASAGKHAAGVNDTGVSSGTSGLRQQLADAEEEFVRLRREILDASPAYRQLLRHQQQFSLHDIQSRLVRSGQILLYYYLAHDAGYVIVVPPDGTPATCVELQMNARQSRLLAAASGRLQSLQKASRSRFVRGLGLSTVISPDRLAASENTEGQSLVVSSTDPRTDASRDPLPVNRTLAADMVRTHILSILNRDLGKERGIGSKTVVSEDRPTGGAATLLADILIPTKVRQLVGKYGTGRVWIVPDGALHQLPFESLVLELEPARLPQRGVLKTVADSDPPERFDGWKFVLDDWAPIVYLPSATVGFQQLARERYRSHPSAGESPQENDLRLLSVGNPEYSRLAPSATGNLTGSNLTGSGSNPTAGSLTRRAVWMQELPSLPGTAEECRRLRSVFGPHRSTLLLGREATESRTRPLLSEFPIIHLAAHGLVDESFDNLFGGIALTPPPVVDRTREQNQQRAGDSADEGTIEDGILSLHEIHDLDLTGCRLAILSACETSVGPDRPMESSSSLARAFLSAGAHCVVASLWSVSDSSTAELMAGFMQRFAKKTASGESTTHEAGDRDLAKALQTARRTIRRHPQWSSPYYWAPFIITGLPPQPR